MCRTKRVSKRNLQMPLAVKSETAVTMRRCLRRCVGANAGDCRTGNWLAGTRIHDSTTRWRDNPHRLASTTQSNHKQQWQKSAHGSNPPRKLGHRRLVAWIATAEMPTPTGVGSGELMLTFIYTNPTKHKNQSPARNRRNNP